MMEYYVFGSLSGLEVDLEAAKTYSLILHGRQIFQAKRHGSHLK
jgi:hypothetical protein